MRRHRLHPKLATPNFIDPRAISRKWVIHNCALKNATIVYEITFDFRSRAFDGFVRDRPKANGNWKRRQMNAEDIVMARSMIPPAQLAAALAASIRVGI